MRRPFVMLVIAGVLLAPASVPAVVDGRGSVAVAGRWEPHWPHIPENMYGVLLAASNMHSNVPECPSPEGCPSLGTLTVASNSDYPYRGSVTCVWVQEPHVYLGVFGGRGDTVTFGAAYVRSALGDVGDFDGFALLEDEPFDCHDEDVREELRVSAGEILWGKAVVLPACPSIFVCPDRT